MDPIYEKDGVKIYHDDNPPNPRTDYDHVGTMVCWHSRYNLGDVQPKEDPGEYLFYLACKTDDELEDLVFRLGDTRNRLYTAVDKNYQSVFRHNVLLNRAKEYVERRKAKALEQYVILNLYLYDHSGLTISVSPFVDRWDSGQVGFIYCSEARALEEGIDDIEACLKAEVEEYDQYLRGEVYGYVKTADKYKLDSEGYVTNDGLRIFKISEFDDIAIVDEVVDALNAQDPQEIHGFGFYGYTPEELADAVLKGEV